MYSYAAVRAEGIVWLEDEESVVDPYVDQDGRSYIETDAYKCPLRSVEVMGCIDLIYRDKDRIILQSPVASLVGKQWKDEHCNQVNRETLEGMVHICT